MVGRVCGAATHMAGWNMQATACFCYVDIKLLAYAHSLDARFAMKSA